MFIKLTYQDICILINLFDDITLQDTNESQSTEILSVEENKVYIKLKAIKNLQELKYNRESI